MKLFLSKGLQRVVIRGIPKEGWKPKDRAADIMMARMSGDQRNP